MTDSESDQTQRKASGPYMITPPKDCQSQDFRLKDYSDLKDNFGMDFAKL